MKKCYLALIIIFIALASVPSRAQFHYVFDIQSEPYRPLTGGTDIPAWGREKYKLPIGFQFKLSGTDISDIGIINNFVVATDTAGTIDGFAILGADLYDRGYASSGTAFPPIRYQLAGNAGNRILKLEVYNVGFYKEHQTYGTAYDSACYQVWLYETTNRVEFHFGPSNISHFSEYFFNGKLQAGFLKNLDMDREHTDRFYYLAGDAGSCTMDSTADIQNLTNGLNTFPASGTIYRFTPYTSSVEGGPSASGAINVYPTLCSNELFIQNKSSKTIEYAIIAINGQHKMIHGKAPNGNNRISTEGLIPGHYVLQLFEADGMKNVRFLKR